MARIYQSRALIDPSLYQLSGQLMNERIRQEHERRKMLSDAITAAGEGLGKTINSGIEEYNKRKQEEGRADYLNSVLAENPEYAKYTSNPFFKAGMNEFIRTGSASPLMAFLGQENTRAIAEEAAAARRQESSQRLAIEQEKARKETELRQANANEKLENIKRQITDAYDRGEDEKADSLLRSGAKLAEANGLDFDYEQAKTDAVAGRERRRQSRIVRSQIENELKKGLRTDSDVAVLRDTVINAYNEGKLVRSDFDELDKELAGQMSIEGQYREGAVKTGVELNNEEIRKKKEEKEKTLELADVAIDKLKKGYKLTKSQQDAYDKAVKNGWRKKVD